MNNYRDSTSIKVQPEKNCVRQNWRTLGLAMIDTEKLCWIELRNDPNCSLNANFLAPKPRLCWGKIQIHARCNHFREKSNKFF